MENRKPDPEVQAAWEKMQAGQCPVPGCPGRSTIKIEGDADTPVDEGYRARVQAASVLFHIAVAHPQYNVEEAIHLWHGQIESMFHLQCPVSGCTFRCSVPPKSARRVLVSHFRQAHPPYRPALLLILTVLATLALLAARACIQLAGR